ncbi:uncharacterized protein P174DRAFT_465011 [Aspergillus novofumigatus IBT 16806]|uniref:Uncharacterized protein n=1 Tax=Aspergillus novofumigatus (strain IBT 16806) TaxID=1392255 RepID=A0A2I1BT24_ASPN1|nr:uncharacterized protein P174DRAFT_465011 [Aspergillus novofumigatus IBT 16806]PKX88494.1 hypothetical protein P174DRAFT_465011 [Aspergillus novofumigatus IBT 16806]
MGNILRQVAKHADGSSNEPMPASSELEKELPRVSVWPCGTSTQDRLVQSIQTGGKLHRVMSGGGGWAFWKQKNTESCQSLIIYSHGDGRTPPTMAMDDLSSLSQARTHSGLRALSELPQGSVSYHFGMVSDADMPATEATEHTGLIAPKIEANSKGGVLGTSTKCDIPGSRIEMTLA